MTARSKVPLLPHLWGHHPVLWRSCIWLLPYQLLQSLKTKQNTSVRKIFPGQPDFPSHHFLQALYRERWCFFLFWKAFSCLPWKWVISVLPRLVSRSRWASQRHPGESSLRGKCAKLNKVALPVAAGRSTWHALFLAETIGEWLREPSAAKWQPGG